MFRFFRDEATNDDFLRNQIQPLFWYMGDVTAKPGVGRVLAEHPSATGPDARPAPLLVVGRFGAGRTAFSAIDDAWRWRFYTGENVFNTYYVQLLRYLARGKRVGERQLTLSLDRPSYQLGETVRPTLQVLDADLSSQLPDQLTAQLVDAQGVAVRSIVLTRSPTQPDRFGGAFTADTLGRFFFAVPSPAAGVNAMRVPLQIELPRLELSEPRVDRATLARLAEQTGGRVVELSEASTQLAQAIPSAQRAIPLLSSQTLWDSPLALVLFLLLITAEWVGRKFSGMV